MASYLDPGMKPTTAAAVEEAPFGRAASELLKELAALDEVAQIHEGRLAFVRNARPRAAESRPEGREVSEQHSSAVNFVSEVTRKVRAVRERLQLLTGELEV